MAYMLSRKKPTASQSYNSFRISSKIAAISETKLEALDLLDDSYKKAMKAATEYDELAKNVPVLPPARELWTWDESLMLAVRVARGIVEHCIMIIVPESAEIHVCPEKAFGNDIAECGWRSLKKSWLFDADDSDVDHVEIDFDAMTRALENIAETGREYRSLPGMTDKSANAYACSSPIVSDSEKEFYHLVFGGSVETFSELLSRMMSRRKVSVNDLCERGNLPISCVDSILAGRTPVPEKGIVEAIGIGLGLTRHGVDKLLAKCGYALSDLFIDDIIVAWHVEHGICGIDDINRALLLCGREPLGTSGVCFERIELPGAFSSENLR